MKLYFKIVLLISVIVAVGTSIDANQNPLICDIEKGVCGADSTSEQENNVKNNTEKPVRIIYFTDPICSSCWGIEPQLRKLKLEYGDVVEIEYRMGGLLPGWNYRRSDGINSPRDVAKHWDKASKYYDMPIDGDVWLENPLASSYPPSVAYKAAEMQGKEKAVKFMRKMREMLFLEKKNITMWSVMNDAAKESGLNIDQFEHDYEYHAQKLFQEDLAMKDKLKVTGFPTMIMVNNAGEEEIIRGSKPYVVYEGAIVGLYENAKKKDYPKNLDSLLEIYPTLTAKEYSILSGKDRVAAEEELKELVAKGKLNQTETKNGNLYYK